ncbi:MAG TPA: serine hydrolase domain-containing protein [Pyrinomonadaceae bacterium]|jgi:CubicO group peptidase (beta-lactamase class C family)|nr:serine hydrolase domain-containing protein [Pyrinomonadaceae bacterium]
MKYKNALLLLLLCILPIFGQSEFPSTPAGKRAAMFLQMLGSKDDAALKDFIAGSMTPNNSITPEQRLERFRGIRTDLAGAKLVKFITAGDQNVVFVVETARGETLKVQLAFAPGEEKLIGGLQVEPVDKNALNDITTGEQKTLTETELVSALQKYLEALSKSDKFSGVVLVAKNGKPVFTSAYGLADRDKNIPNRIDTKFNIGSENKIFTQFAIGMLADEGKLSLKDTVGKFLPDYPNKEAAEKVTIEQLLTMRSGIGDFFGPKFAGADKTKIRALKDYFPFFASDPLLFAPGTDSRYSNGGYVVLGAIIEKVSGKSYYDFVRERIFRPAGMSDTDSYESDAGTDNMAMGYTMRITPGKLMNNLTTRPARGSSAGGGYSTAGDMLKFAGAIESGKLGMPKSLSASSDPRLSQAGAGGIGIAGGAPGINAAFDTKLKGIYTVVVMSNLDPPSAEEVSRQIRTWLGGN